MPQQLFIGLAKTKEAWQTNLGSLATAFHNRMLDVHGAKGVQDATPDAELTDATVGFTQDEVTYMKSGTNDLDVLAQLYLGLITFDAAAAAVGKTGADTYAFADGPARLLRGVIGS